MKIYKVVKKKLKEEHSPFWEDQVLIVAATTHGNAEDKAKNFQISTDGKPTEIVSIQVIGETTDKPDVFIFRDRY